jgi:cytochrome b
MDTHLRAGYCVLTLLIFRLGWALWGGRHSRLAAYRPRPARLWAQFSGRLSKPDEPHTPFGALLAIAVWALVALQAGTGLFSSDDIFTEGPFAGRVDDEAVDLATSVHVRVYWLVLALIGGHVAAIAWYGIVRRDALAAAMFTGRKAGPAIESRNRLALGAGTLAGAGALVYAALEYF